MTSDGVEGGPLMCVDGSGASTAGTGAAGGEIAELDLKLLGWPVAPGLPVTPGLGPGRTDGPRCLLATRLVQLVTAGTQRQIPIRD
jgi:hypothetical protein